MKLLVLSGYDNALIVGASARWHFQLHHLPNITITKGKIRLHTSWRSFRSWWLLAMREPEREHGTGQHGPFVEIGVGQRDYSFIEAESAGHGSAG